MSDCNRYDQTVSLLLHFDSLDGVASTALRTLLRSLSRDELLRIREDRSISGAYCSIGGSFADRRGLQLAGLALAAMLAVVLTFLIAPIHPLN